mgnify:CR=1 FL=1
MDRLLIMPGMSVRLYPEKEQPKEFFLGCAVCSEMPCLASPDRLIYTAFLSGEMDVRGCMLQRHAYFLLAPRCRYTPYGGKCKVCKTGLPKANHLNCLTV